MFIIWTCNHIISLSFILIFFNIELNYNIILNIFTYSLIFLEKIIYDIKTIFTPNDISKYDKSIEFVSINL